MTSAHRSIDGTTLHAGFIEDCAECAPRTNADTHSPDDHHPYVDVSMSGVTGGFCYCGSPAEDAIHERPFCGDCAVPEPSNYGAPRPWLARIYSRLVARFGRY